MTHILSEGTCFGGVATGDAEMILPQNLNCALVDITNLSQTKWLHCSLGPPGSSGSVGIAIAPNGFRTLNTPRGRLYVWTPDGSSVSYSGFYCH